MSRKRSWFGTLAGSPDWRPGTVGRFLTRAGAVLVVTAIPLTIATFVAILVAAPDVGAGVATALAATTGPLAADGGVDWLLHVGVLAVLVGCWSLGAGLVLSGLSD